jgi:hypothetical protein
MSLFWQFNGEGAWMAESRSIRNRSYTIAVCDDGTFDVSESDDELCQEKRWRPRLLPAAKWPACFDSLLAAKSWCQENDDALPSLVEDEVGAE